MKMSLTAKTVRRKKIIFLIIINVIMIALLVSLYCVLVLQKRGSQQFDKPSFDKNVISAQQVDTTDQSYSMLKVKEGYQVGLCGQPRQKGNQLSVSLVNPRENKVWLQLFLYDEKQNLIASSGIVRQGEGLQYIPLKRALASSEKIKMQVAGYEPYTYYSMGEMNLQTNIYK